MDSAGNIKGFLTGAVWLKDNNDEVSACMIKVSGQDFSVRAWS